MEVVGHERGGRAGRAGGRNEERQGLVQEIQEEARRRGAALRQIGVRVAPHCREPRLHHRNQRRDRGEGELEADAENRLRLDGDDGEDRESEVAHGQRPPVDDDRSEHDQGHDERAFRADPRAGGHVVEERARHGDGGGPFLDRVVQGKRRRQSEQTPGHEEKDSGDQRHLNAGDRDDVEDAGLADEVLGVVGEEVALARHHGGGDRALVAADDPVDPDGEAVAGVVDRGAEALAKARVGRRRQDFDRAENRADRADAGEEGVAGEVVAAGQRRMRGRQEPRLQRRKIARRDSRGLAGRHAHTTRRRVARQAVGARDRNDQARADRPEIDLLDIALQAHDADAVEHRRGDARGAQRHRQEPGRERGEGEPEAQRHGPRARKDGEPSEERGQPGRQPEDRLAVSRQIERDAAHRRDREPQEEAPFLNLAGERPRQGRAPVGRGDGRARSAGRRQNANAPRS